MDAHLSSADVAGCLVLTDVLLAGLQRQAERLAIVGVARNANNATWHVTLKLVSRGEEGS